MLFFFLGVTLPCVKVTSWTKRFGKRSNIAITNDENVRSDTTFETLVKGALGDFFFIFENEFIFSKDY